MTDQLGPLDAEIRDLFRFAAERSMLPRFRVLSDAEIELKDGNDPVTVVDREIEEFLTEALSKLAPGVPVVGEEAAHNDKHVLDHLSQQCWIIDPLDGTANFTEGKTPFGIMIALADAGEAVAGWIYDPLSDRLCHAKRGEGAFINGEIVTSRTTGQSQPVAAISKLFLDESERAEIDMKIAPHYTFADIPRCAAEQYPRLALGQNDVSTFKRTLAWDHAAGVLWLNEAGGKAARIDGSDYRVDQHSETGLIGASTPQIWEAFVERLNRAPD